MLRVKLAVASQVRIDKSSNKNVLREKTRFGSVFRNQNFEASELQFASSSPRELKDLFPEFPNTLPPQDLECWSLAASEFALDFGLTTGV